MDLEEKKSAVLIMKRGKLFQSEGIDISGEKLSGSAMNDGDVDA